VTSSQTTDRLTDGVGAGGEKLPIQMLNDRVLVHLGGPEGERRSTGGILIPATAQIGKRLVWAEVMAVGPNVRSMEPGDQVLFSPEDRYEVEVRDAKWGNREITKIKVTVDGKQLYEYFDFEKRFPAGHFAFQQHDPGSRVTIRKVEVLPLED
jgi:co-chaperonin GroES (HSP10)